MCLATPFDTPKHSVALRTIADISPETGIRRNDELSLALRVTLHSDCLSASVRVSHPSVEEQLMGHSHVSEVRNVCRSAARLNLVRPPCSIIDAETATPSAW